MKIQNHNFQKRNEWANSKMHMNHNCPGIKTKTKKEKKEKKRSTVGQEDINF